jgi:outer membrane receptor protein involved in Fe transport
MREVQFEDTLMVARRWAPSYWTFDYRIEYKYADVTLFAGIMNITDFYQAKEEPLFYQHEYFIKTNNIWGPLRGRQYYLGFSINGDIPISNTDDGNTL